MYISPLQRGIYNHQADRIEKALSSFALPTRVQGGEVGRNRVRYHLAPLPNMPTHQVREIALKVAEAMGVYQVRVDEVEDGWVLDLPIEGDFSLRLLPFIEGLNNLLPLTAVLGITASGKPMLLNLRRIETWHAFVYGSTNTGKSELLRTFILSLALKNRPSQVQFLGIDLTGKELVVLDALPHTLSEVAVDASYAEEVICWMVDEVERRKEDCVSFPDVILFVDELECVLHHSETLLKKLPLILTEGPKTGVHLIAASKEIRPGSIMPNWRRSGVVIAKAGNEITQRTIRNALRGQFEFQVCGERIDAQVAWLPVYDLQQAVRIVCAGDPSTRWDVDLRALWK
jgi:DNA segregation ATPase FtsK/SpoIIIE-like protein